MKPVLVFIVAFAAGMGSARVCHGQLQTAPGKGICIRNYTFGGLGGRDTILRFKGNIMEGIAGPEGPTGTFKGMNVRGQQDAPVTVSVPFFEHHVRTHIFSRIPTPDKWVVLGIQRPWVWPGQLFIKRSSRWLRH